MEHSEIREHEISTETKGFARFAWVSWMFVIYLFDHSVESLGRNVRIVWREFDLFFGAALTALGLFGFSAGRYCDGNTAEYLSCTRPSSYYYFDAWHIALIILGVVFILLWLQKNHRRE